MNMNHRPCDAEPLPEQLRVFHSAAAEQVRQFHLGMAGYAETPLRELKGLAGTLGLCKLLVKDESLRFGLNAFKVLGGSYAMGRLLAERDGIQPEELIGEYCDLDAIAKALHSGDDAAARKEIDKAMRGFLAEEPDDETLSLLVNCLFVVLQYHVFYDYLDRAKLMLSDTHADRAAMRRD